MIGHKSQKLSSTLSPRGLAKCLSVDRCVAPRRAISIVRQLAGAFPPPPTSHLLSVVSQLSLIKICPVAKFAPRAKMA